MIKVFISYRHRDSGNVAQRIYRYLCKTFGEDYIFIDKNTEVNSIEELVSIVHNVDVLLVIISHEWLKLLEEKQQQPNTPDYVFQEIKAGLMTDGILVIPVAIDAEHFPPATMLPSEIKSLPSKVGMIINNGDDATFSNDMEKLTKRIKRRHEKRYGGAIGVYNELPNEILKQSVNNASKQVWIMCIWTSRLGTLYPSLIKAISKGADVRFLFLDPENECLTSQRDDDLGHQRGYTKGHIESTIKELRHFVQDTPHLNTSNVQLRLYNATPSRVLYIADESILIGSHPVMELSANAPHIHVFGEGTNMYDSMIKHFQNLWESKNHVRDISLK